MLGEDARKEAIEDLRNYANENIQEPLDINEAYIVGFDTLIVNEAQQFCLVWSTRRLKSLQSWSRSIQLDRTYKLKWLRFPIIVAYNLHFCFNTDLMSLGLWEDYYLSA